MLYNYLYNLQLIISNYWLLQCCKMMLHGSSLHNQFLRQQPHSSSSSMNSVMFLVLPLSATWSTEAQLRVVFWSQKSSKSFRSFFWCKALQLVGYGLSFQIDQLPRLIHSCLRVDVTTSELRLKALLFCFPSTIPTSHDWSCFFLLTKIYLATKDCESTKKDC